MNNAVTMVSSQKNYITTLNKVNEVNFYIHIKRIIDILFSLTLLILFCIPMLIISLLIKVEDSGTVLFKQRRTGKNGKNINIYKFRSMIVENDVRDLKCEDKYTKVGKFIRKTSLDELPQIINILKGEMSFIGPRPWIPEYYENMNVMQRERVKVLPGLTGLAQISGRNGISINEKIVKDLEYVDKLSFKEDLKILIRTFTTVFEKENVNIGKMGINEEIETLKNQNSVFNL